MGGRGAIRVLLAESDQIVRSLVREQLDSDERFVVVEEAVDGDHAVASSVDFDLAVVDLRIAGRGGLGTVAALHHRHPDIPVVAVTYNDSAHLRHAALDEGAVAVLPYPASLDHFPNHLADVTGVIGLP